MIHALKKISIALAVTAVTLVAMPSAQAQNYPDKPIRLIVPYSAGGGSDIVGRHLANVVGKELGQTIIVENRPGASATIGANAVAKSAPDGYTLLLADSPHAINASVLPSLPYNPVEDFTAIAMIGRTPLVLVVNPKQSATTFEELVTASKSPGAKLNIASGGTGTLTHLVGAMMQERGGLSLLHVPYKGTGQALGDVVAGHVEMMISTAPGAIPLIKAGSLRALAISSQKRSEFLPDVPTFAESGMPNFIEYTWYGLLGPAGMDKTVVDHLNIAVNKALTSSELKKALEAAGVEPQPSPPENLGSTIAVDLAKWMQFTARHNIKID